MKYTEDQIVRWLGASFAESVSPRRAQAIVARCEAMRSSGDTRHYTQILIDCVGNPPTPYEVTAPGSTLPAYFGSLRAAKAYARNLVCDGGALCARIYKQGDHSWSWACRANKSRTRAVWLQA